MPLPFRRPIKPEFTVPPAESRDQAELLADLDQRLENFRLVPPAERTAAMRRLVDNALDLRNAIRPARADSYQEST